MNNLNIVFFGKDNFSCVILQSLIDAGHIVSLVVTPEIDNDVYKRLESVSLSNGIPFLRIKKINSEETVERVKAAKPDLCVIGHFDRIIKSDLLRIPPVGFINLHPSLLPKYRGMAPEHWPIINGEKETGITVHYVDETLDTGDIILQRHIPLSDDMYVFDLQRIWLEEYKTIIVEAIERILTKQPTLSQKNLGEGSFYGSIKDNDYIIPQDCGVIKAYAMVRAFSMPYKGAIYDDTTIMQAHIVENPNAELMNLPIGIHSLDGDNSGDYLRLKDGVLEIDM